MGTGLVRLLWKRRSPEEQYKRYRLARQAVALGVLSLGSPQAEAAKKECLAALGPAFDPTLSAWPRLNYIDAGLVAFMAGAVDVDAEDPRDLEIYAEQILAIVALDIDTVTPEVLLEVGRNFVAEASRHHAGDLRDAGVPEDVAHTRGFDDALVVARRLLASPRTSTQGSARS